MYIYEVLFRGRDAENEPGQEAGLHVVLAEWADDALTGTKVQRFSSALTPGQAAARGFDMPAILAAINTQIHEDNVALKAAAETAQAEVVAAQDQIAQLQAEIAKEPAPAE